MGSEIPANLAIMPKEIKTKIVGDLETADKLSVRLVTHEFKNVVDRTKMHYEALIFEFGLTSFRVSLSVPGGKPLILKTQCIEAASKKFLEVLLKPNNSIGKLQIVLDTPLHRRTAALKMKKETFLKILQDGLRTLKHQISVEQVFMNFDRYQEVTDVLKHLVPRNLKSITCQCTAPRLAPNQSEVDELAELEQFRQAKELRVYGALLPLSPEKTAHFVELKSKEEEFKVEKMDEIIENFLKPNGWAYRSLTYGQMDMDQLFGYLEKRSRKEFGKRLEEVIEVGERLPFGRISRPLTVTFHRGFYECSVKICQNFPVLEDGEPQPGEHEYGERDDELEDWQYYWPKLKFTNAKMMLWKDVCSRPDVITEELFEKEKDRQAEEKRQAELRRAERLLKIEQEQRGRNDELDDGRRYGNGPPEQSDDRSSLRPTSRNQFNNNQSRNNQPNRQSSYRNQNYQSNQGRSNRMDYGGSEQYRNGRSNRGSYQSNQRRNESIRRDQRYGSNQYRDEQYNRNSSNRCYQSYQEDQWHRGNHSSNRDSSSRNQPRSSQPNHQEHDSRRGSWTSYQDTRRDDRQSYQPPYQEDQWQQPSPHEQNNRRSIRNERNRNEQVARRQNGQNQYQNRDQHRQNQYHGQGDRNLQESRRGQFGNQHSNRGSRQNPDNRNQQSQGRHGTHGSRQHQEDRYYDRDQHNDRRGSPNRGPQEFGRGQNHQNRQNHQNQSEYNWNQGQERFDSRQDHGQHQYNNRNLQGSSRGPSQDQYENHGRYSRDGLPNQGSRGFGQNRDDRYGSHTYQDRYGSTPTHDYRQDQEDCTRFARLNIGDAQRRDQNRRENQNYSSYNYNNRNHHRDHAYHSDSRQSRNGYDRREDRAYYSSNYHNNHNEYRSTYRQNQNSRDDRYDESGPSTSNYQRR